VARAILNRRGELTGEELESAVVAEVIKQLANAGIDFEPFHLRTHDGREVDLLIELERGIVALEVKRSARVGNADVRGLLGLEEILDRPVIGASVLSMESAPRRLEGGALSLPVAWALSA
jgi:predicted AAA+ superfamily ATPase